MSVRDALGWAACLMTLIMFVQVRMLPLRIAAICANVLFISYAVLGHYTPILTLHASLLPVNCYRLFALTCNARLATLKYSGIRLARSMSFSECEASHTLAVERGAASERIDIRRDGR